AGARAEPARAVLMSCFFSRDCRTECSHPSGMRAASASTATFASTRIARNKRARRAFGRLFCVLAGSAAWQLLESFPDQLLKLLRLRDESLHTVLSKLRPKRHNILGGSYIADLASEC